MTISKTHCRKEYTGNGALLIYPYDFYIGAASELLVYVAGVLKTLGVDYSVSGAGNDEGGNVTFVVGSTPALDASIVFLRSTPKTQPTDLAAGQKFYEADIEGMCDRLSRQVQELEERFNRVPSLGNSSLLGPLVLPVGAGKYLRWNGGLTGLELVDPTPGVGATFTDITVNGNILGDGGVVLTGIADIIAKGPGGDVRWYLPAGFVTDGSIEYSTEIQAAIDAAFAQGGGVITFPNGIYKAIDLVLKSGVILMGSPSGYGYLPGGITRTKFLAAGTGIIVDTPVGGATGAGVIGIDFQGLGAGTTVRGIRVRAGSHWNQFGNLHFNDFSEEGIVSDITSLACVFEDILAINCVLDRARADFIGAVDIHGTDHFLNRIESSISGSIEGTVQSANLYCVGILLRGTNCFMSNCVGEISDIGIYVGGESNRISNCRADLNYGHGFYIVSGTSLFATCTALSNSQDTTNAYDGFHATAASSLNMVSSCVAYAQTAKVHRYGFNDLQNGATLKNQYVAVRSILHGTKGYVNQSQGSVFSFPPGPPVTLADGDTTPSVEGYSGFVFSQTNPTTVTDFDNRVYGQVIHLSDMGASRTTIKHGTNIYTNTGADKELVAWKIYTFFDIGGVWVEAE
jgi:hypothetical protein